MISSEKDAPPSRSGLVARLVLTFLVGTGVQLVNARTRFQRQDAESPNRLLYWPNGTIPYTFPSTYTETQRNTIRVGMARWEQQTCIKFVPWTDEVQEHMGTIRYLRFLNGITCFSRYGLNRGQPQSISINDNCMGIDTIIRELGHAIGMLHTMERNDRDTYITVQYENIIPSYRWKYKTAAMKGKIYPYYGTPYDYKSIMHYGPKYLSSNGKPAMLTTDAAYQAVIGKAKTVSYYDAVYVNRAYNCAERCEFNGLRCENGGVVGGSADRKCSCLCPDGLMGEFCETPVPGFQHIVRWDCGTTWDYANGNCYQFFPSVAVDYAIAVDLCANHGGNVVSFKSTEEVKWLKTRIDENFIMTPLASFWAGVKRRAGETDYLLPDLSVFDASLMPLHELGTSDTDGCATTNGQSLIIGNCDMKPDNGVICMKPFDARCGGRYRLTTASVYIQSPGFPDGYPASTTCQYVFQANSGMKIEIIIDSFDILESTNCGNDNLEVHLTSNVTERGQIYCGSSLSNKTLISEGTLAILTFKSNSRDFGQGFTATVRAVPLRDDSNNVETDTRNSVLGGFMFDNDSNDTTTDSPEILDTHASFLQVLWNMFSSFTVSSIL
ncbi:zinc metalloproteinase nas-36-like [Pecten maximus]|uniref:zinc metalloproteinase nas-36-like n=1 Tax=Pecten maximus TaxID=6579 RepID=UPI001458C25E|nr:zinc metalloproteinase nas-36-like [Pecten maximus]